MSERDENDRFEAVARFKSRAYLTVFFMSALVACGLAFPAAHGAQLGFLPSVLWLCLSTMCLGLYFRFKQRLEDRQRDTKISALEARVSDLESKTGEKVR